MVTQVSPFANFSDFFRPIYPSVDMNETLPEENFAFLRESINIFDFGQKGFTLLPKGLNHTLVLAEAEGSQHYWLETAFRVLKIATIIIPLIHLAGAAIYFLANDFQLQAPQENIVRYIPLQIEKTTLPVFDLLNPDILRLLFMHLGAPYFFKLGMSDKKNYKFMMEDVSLEKFHVIRDILKQCCDLASTQHIQSERLFKMARNSLLKCLTCFDLEAAFQRADANKELNLKIEGLVAVSEAYANFDMEKSLEILKHAYNETVLVGTFAKSFFGSKSITEEEHLSWLSASLALMKCYTKIDMKVVNKLFKDLEGEFIGTEIFNDYWILKNKLKIYQPLSSLKCITAETLNRQEDNVRLTIGLIRELFKVFPDKAQLFVEDLLEFLDTFIERFPEAKGVRSYLLLDLSDVLVEYEMDRACELAGFAIREFESINFEVGSELSSWIYIKCVKILGWFK